MNPDGISTGGAPPTSGAENTNSTLGTEPVGNTSIGPQGGLGDATAVSQEASQIQTPMEPTQGLGVPFADHPVSTGAEASYPTTQITPPAEPFTGLQQDQQQSPAEAAPAAPEETPADKLRKTMDDAINLFVNAIEKK